MGKTSFLKNRIVFFGTPSFASDVFAYLIAHHVPIVGVVTQPDRPKGRSLQLSSSPVKEIVQRLAPDLPLFQPEKASEDVFLQQIAGLQADLYVVVAYGQILSQKLLSLPRLGCINLHASLLPKYRGAAPMQRCLMEGERETGVTVQKMVKQMDAGDVIATDKIAIPQEMILGELETQLRDISKPLLLEVIQKYEKGIPEGSRQDPLLATYAAKIELEEGEICWGTPSEKIHNLIRAFSPRPGAWARMNGGGRVKILRSCVQKVEGLSGHPGQIVSRDGLVLCGLGCLQLVDVQPEGKRVMKASEWLRGAPNIQQFLVEK